MLLSVRIPARTIAALGTALAYGAGFWLVLLHHAEGGRERGEPGLLVHALRDGTLALPGVLAAVWLGGTLALGLVDRDRRLPGHLRAALLAAGAATASAIVLAAGNPLHGLLFSAEEPHALAPGAHLLRDALLAMGVAMPTAGAVLAAPFALTRAAALRRAAGAPLGPGAAAAAAAPPPAPLAATPAVAAVAGVELTRRTFVAGGLAGAGVAGALLTRASRPARAEVVADRLHLFINDGHVAMVDGAMVYMRGYGAAAAADPSPSLAIEPHVFLAKGNGPVESHFYPLVDPSRVPPHGSPTAAGVDPSGIGLHLIHRRHWASSFPRRTIVAETGSEIRLRITNTLREPHTFTIDGVVDVTVAERGAPGATKDVEFPAPGPGTYVYHDTTNAPVNRVLGLHGVLVVVPAEAPWTLDGEEGEFERQFLWVFHDIDSAWGRRARLGATIDPEATPSVPDYFTLNGRSGVFSSAVSLDEAENERTVEDTKPSGHGRRVDVRRFSDPNVGTGQLIRLVNTGLAVHQPHFHGNHVWTLAVDNEVLSRSTPRISADGHVLLQQWEDVVELDPMGSKTVMLPIKPPPDALDEVLADRGCDFVYPMHCHAEMSQTAGGGLYPGGMVTDWTLKP